MQCNWLRKSCELAIGVRTPHLHPLPFFKRRGALLQPQLTINEHYQINVRTSALLPGAVTPAQDWAAHVFRVLAEPALSEVEGAFRPSEIPMSLVSMQSDLSKEKFANAW